MTAGAEFRILFHWHKNMNENLENSEDFNKNYKAGEFKTLFRPRKTRSSDENWRLYSWKNRSWNFGEAKSEQLWKSSKFDNKILFYYI